MTPEQKAEDNKAFTYEITKRIAVLSRHGNITKELNLISYRGKPAKYDIRSWEYNGTEKNLGKGVTLDETELMELKKALFNGV